MEFQHSAMFLFSSEEDKISGHEEKMRFKTLMNKTGHVPLLWDNNKTKNPWHSNFKKKVSLHVNIFNYPNPFKRLTGFFSFHAQCTSHQESQIEKSVVVEPYVTNHGIVVCN